MRCRKVTLWIRWLYRLRNSAQHIVGSITDTAFWYCARNAPNVLRDHIRKLKHAQSFLANDSVHRATYIYICLPFRLVTSWAGSYMTVAITRGRADGSYHTGTCCQLL